MESSSSLFCLRVFACEARDSSRGCFPLISAHLLTSNQRRLPSTVHATPHPCNLTFCFLGFLFVSLSHSLASSSPFLLAVGVPFPTGCWCPGGDGRQGGVGDARPQRVLHRERPAEPDQGRGRHLRGFQRGGALGQEGAAVA